MSRHAALRLVVLCAGLVVVGGAQAQATDAGDRLADARAAVVALEARYTELETAHREQENTNKELEKTNKELTAANARLKQAHASSQAAARRYSGQMARRTYRNVARHVAGMPAVAIPYVGAGVTAAMTALDIREGCEALRELNELNRAMQIEPESEAQVCAMQAGSREEIINKVLVNWRTAYAVAAAWTNQQEIWLSPDPIPVEPARAVELWSAVFGALPNPVARTAPVAPRGPTPPNSPISPQAPVLPGYPAR